MPKIIREVAFDGAEAKIERLGLQPLIDEVRVQLSIRSDRITRDIVHFQKQLRQGSVDLYVLILPSDALAKYLPDRAPHFNAGLRIVDEMRADDLPMLFIAIEHDGSGPALTKAITNRGTGTSTPH